jgi:RAB protein geranylgeranyltransferase component A
MNYRKIGLFTVLIILLSCQSLALTQLKAKTVYHKIFSDVDQIMLYKLDINSNHDCQVFITGADLKKIRHGLKRIKYVQEIYADRTDVKSFKEGFRVLFLMEGERNLPILYSPAEDAIMVNKEDVVPYQEKDQTKITVLQFKVKKSVMKIIERYEAKLPSNGFFIDSWPYNEE